MQPPDCVNAIHPKALLQSEGLVFNPASGSDGLTQGADKFSRNFASGKWVFVGIRR